VSRRGFSSNDCGRPSARLVAAALVLGAWALLARPATAGTIAWDGDTDRDWSTAGNWVGGVVPSSTDTASFVDLATEAWENVNIDADVVVGGITMASGFDGTFSYTQNNRIIVLGNFTMSSGTTATFAAGSRLVVTGNFTFAGGTFNHSTGTVFLTPLAAATPTHAFGGATFNNLVIGDPLDLSSGLVGWWKLDETATPAADSSGNGNSLTWTNGGGSHATRIAPVLFTNSHSFSTSSPLTSPGTYLEKTSVNTFKNTSWTLSGWFKDTNPLDSGSGCGDGTGASEIVNAGNDYFLRICNSSGQAVLNTQAKRTTSSYDSCTSSTFGLNNNIWHHAAASRSGTTLLLYLDGVKTTCTAGGTQNATGTTFRIGANSANNSYDFPGRLDDVRVYNRALTDGEIMALFAGSTEAGGTVSHSSSGSLTINGDLNLGSASNTWTGSSAVTLKGSWLNNGGYYSGTGAVTLSGTNGGSIQSNSQEFASLTINATGETWTLLDRLWVDGVLTITAGTLDTASYVVHAATLSKTDGAAAVFTPGTGTLVLDSSTPRILTVDSALYNLQFEDPTETNLVAYWKFDEGVGTTARDSSGNGLTATLGSGTWASSAVAGNVSSVSFDNPAALSLDGSSDYLSFTPPTHSSQLTISAWIKRTADGDTFPRIVTLPTARLYLNIASAGVSDKIGFYQDCAGTDGQWETTTTFTRAAWHHIAVTYNFGSTSNDPILYLDGVVQAQTETVTPTSTTCTNTGTGYIGGQNATSSNLAARIDDVRIYNTILTQAQITALAGGGYAGTGGTTTFTRQANTTVSGTATTYSGTSQTVYRAYEDVGGAIEGYPAVAFDWANYGYHATYVAYNNVGGTSSRIYKRDTTGTAQGYFSIASPRTFVGTPKWTHDAVANSAVYYIYAIDDQGTVYKLTDASFTSSGGSATTTYRNGASASATSPLAADTTNLYWTGLAADGTTSTVFRLLQSNMTTVSSTATTTVINGAVPTLASVNSASYIFFANTSKLYSVAVSPSLGSLNSSSWAPSAAVYGRVTVQDGVVYFIDSLGKLFASNPSDLSSTWTYQDTGTHACSSTTCAAKNLFLNNKTLAAANGNAIWGDYDGHLYSINTTTHAALTGYPWRPGTSSDIFETAPLYRAGVVVIGSKIGKLYVVDHRTVTAGTPALIASYDFCTSATCTSGSAINSVGYDFDTGTQYVVGTADGKIFYISSSTDPTNSDN
jgi:hypothetical protein